MTKSEEFAIHPSAIISKRATIGHGCEIGPFAIIHDNVLLGERVKVGAYCELGIPTALGNGSPLVIGDGSIIRSHSTFYESSIFGRGLMTGHYVVVREKTVAGENFQIGTKSEIQGDCRIGDHVRFQSSIFVSKHTTIGNFVWVLPYTVFANDPTPPSNNLIGATIEDFATISACCVILPGVTLGHHSVIAAGACVTRDVAPQMLAAGAPAKEVKAAKDVLLRDGSNSPAYPWTTHFSRGYPPEMVAVWKNEE